MSNIAKIVSGGQTGADRAGLDWAISSGVPHGGWCPKGRKAEGGPVPGQYRLVETPSSSYLQRTEWNVRDSDGTLIFTMAANLTGGSLRTAQFAEKHRKPCLHVSHAKDFQPALVVQRFVQDHGIKTLNVAGSRGSKEPELHRWVMQVLEGALFWRENHPTIMGGPGEG